jgi:5-methylcytosine-specific restriction endonuclease McrA
MARVLILNADAQPLSLLPLSTISWQNAVKAYFQDKVKILHSYERVLHAARFEMQMPSIVMLTEFQKSPATAKFTRKNLYLRDSNICQYCGKKFSSGDLTIDHVIPRAMGGRTTWMNTVSACMPCNSRKGKQLLRPLRDPFRPSWHEMNSNAKKFDVIIPDPAWQYYIQWPEEHLIIDERHNGMSN